MGEVSFTNYTKITDFLCFLTSDIMFGVLTTLSRSDNGKNTSFHQEYKYSRNGDIVYSIKRNVTVGFIIKSVRGGDSESDNIYIRPGDVPLLQLILTNSVMPWLMGDGTIFDYDKNGKMILKGKFKKVIYTFCSGNQYLGFYPIVYTYPDDRCTEGVRMYLNDDNRYIDISMESFLSFYYYICGTDLYNSAVNAMTYAKVPPYEQNVIELDCNMDFNRRERKKNFFDKS